VMTAAAMTLRRRAQAGPSAALHVAPDAGDAEAGEERTARGAPARGPPADDPRRRIGDVRSGRSRSRSRRDRPLERAGGDLSADKRCGRCPPR
jgi:hypothetical protein